jgi:hypothetical protein
MTTTIEPTLDGLGNPAFRVTRILPTFISAQVGKAALDSINPADLEPPVAPPPPGPVVNQQPPNCDGFAAEILIELTEGDE